MNVNYYETLEIPRTATSEGITMAFRRLALKYHPEKNPSNKAANTQKFDEICEANGQKGLTSFDDNSVPSKPETFVCEQGIGEKRKDMKTIVIAPNNEIYLTDGHHTFNTFWHL